MIPGQLMKGARQTKNAPLGRTAFSPLHGNLGDCRQFVRGDTFKVAFNQINPSWQVEVREISLYFDEESVFTEGETPTRDFWGTPIYMQWNTFAMAWL